MYTCIYYTCIQTVTIVVTLQLLVEVAFLTLYFGVIPLNVTHENGNTPYNSD